MISLADYIQQRLFESKEERPESKSFSFSFKEFPKAKETIESLVELAEEKGLEHDHTESSFDITLKAEECTDSEKVSAIRDMLQQYATELRKDSKNASSESYAQLTHKFKDKVDELASFIDTANEPEDEEEPEEDKKDDKKEEE